MHFFCFCVFFVHVFYTVHCLLNYRSKNFSQSSNLSEFKFNHDEGYHFGISRNMNAPNNSVNKTYNNCNATNSHDTINSFCSSISIFSTASLVVIQLPLMDGIGKLCSKHGLLSGIVVNHIAIDGRVQTGFKNWESRVHPLHKVEKPNIIDRLSLFNGG